MRITRLTGILTFCLATGLTACTSGSATTPPATGSDASLNSGVAVSDACSVLSSDQVASATGQSVTFTRQGRKGKARVCTFGSTSGQEVVLTVSNAPSAGLTSTGFISEFKLTPVSGIGDSAYAGPTALIASKGGTMIILADADVRNISANHEQILETLAKDVFTKF